VRERLLDWAMAIVAAEEAARAAAKVAPAPAPTFRTVTGKRTDIPLPTTIIDEKGSGQLKELLIKSDFKDWRLAVYADGQQLYDNSYDWFMGISQELEEIDAFQAEDGTYILHLSDIKFAKSLKVVAESLTVVSIQERPKLKEIFYKLEIRSEGNVAY